jgi:hypothetical protein
VGRDQQREDHGQCVTGRRFATVEDLGDKTTAGQEHSNAKQRSVDWQFKVADARVKLKSIYPRFEVRQRTCRVPVSGPLTLLSPRLCHPFFDNRSLLYRYQSL